MKEYESSILPLNYNTLIKKNLFKKINNYLLI